MSSHEDAGRAYEATMSELQARRQESHRAIDAWLEEDDAKQVDAPML